MHSILPTRSEGMRVSAGHRRKIEQMSAPVVAWLVDHLYINDDCGILDVPRYMAPHIREGYHNGLRETMGAIPRPLPRERMSK